MNLLGKIMTLMILLLSVCFLMIAVMVNASHQNWKQMALDNKAKAESLAQNRRTILDEVQKKDQRLKTEVVARTLRIQQLESQVQMALKNYEEKEQELTAALVVSQERLAVAKESNERLAEQDKEVAALQAQLKTLIQDVAAQREKVVAMTNRIYELEGAERSLDALRQQLASENALLVKVLKKNGLAATDLTSLLEPQVDGVVVSIRDNTIEVNLGTDDGLRRGHTVDLHRDGRYVGSAVITIAEPNRSAARIDPSLTKVAVQQGDLVTTNWVRAQR